MLPIRSLIINADDFGYNDAITQGILRGYREGLITSTTAMINLPGAAERIAAGHAAEPGLPIGLHLNLTAGRPVLSAAQVPHLVRADGSFYPFEDLLLRLAEIPLAEVRAELRAQAEALVAAGVAFDHIDYHQQVMALYTPFFEVVAELARDYRVPVRQPALTNVRGRHNVLPKAGQDSLGTILGFLGRALIRHPLSMARLLIQLPPDRRSRIAAGLGTTRWFVGALFGDPSLENFTAILSQLPPGDSELMTHPAVESPELFSMAEGYRAERPQELALLCDPRAREAVERLGIRLTDFGEVRRLKYAT